MLLRFLCIFLISLAALSSAQARDYQFMWSPISDQLTQKWVWNIYQDSRGMIWFLSQEGLNRYDGYGIRQYRHNPSDPRSISSDTVANLIEDSTGVIWVATAGGGLSRYDVASDSFDVLRHDPGNPGSLLTDQLWSLGLDDAGNIWIGYRTGGFSRFDPDSGEFVHYAHESNELIGPESVNDIIQTADGSMWIATEGNGLLRVMPGGDNLLRYGHGLPGQLHSDHIARLLEDSLGRLWVGTFGDGLFMLPRDRSSFLRYELKPDPDGPIEDRIFNMIEDTEGAIWFGLQTALAKLRPDGSFQYFTGQNSGLQPGGRVAGLWQSSDGVIWIGTPLGVSKGRRMAFPVFTRDTGLASETVNAFAETSGGIIWVGSDAGLQSLQIGDDGFLKLDPLLQLELPDPQVMSLWGEDNVLWIGTYTGGLHRLDLTQNELTSYRNDPEDPTSLGADGVVAIRRDSLGRLWVGTYGGGLNLFDDEAGQFIRYTHDPEDANSISSDMIMKIFQERAGTLWVGTEQGINRLNESDRSFTRFQHDPREPTSLGGYIVWDMAEDDASNLWIGTRGSLNFWGAEQRRRRTAEFQGLHDRLGLPSSHIYTVYADLRGLVWLSHNSGLSVVNPVTRAARHFDVHDGLQDNEFNQGAAFRDSRGRLFFGGNHGFNVVPEVYQLPASTPPEATITGVKVLNKPVTFDVGRQPLPTLELGHRDYLVSVSFTATDFSNPEANRYQYKLEGFDQDWIDLENERTATFTNLPAGDYVLRVKAANSAGFWNENAIELPVSVSPAPWWSWQAKTVYGLILLAMALYPVHLQRRKVARALELQKLLERQVAERTAALEVARQDAVDANKAKSAFLATMSHEIRTPMHGMLGMTELLQQTQLDGQQRRYAKIAHQSGEALLGLINSILDLSKLEASRVELESAPFNLLAMLDDLCYMQSEPAARKGLDLNLVYDPELGSGMVGDGGKLRQVLMNLVNNAIKFTHDGRVDVLVRAVESGIEIDVKDTGVGMDEAARARVFEAFAQADASTTRKYGGTGLGLSISRQYTELMGGSIALESSPGHGSTFTVSVPLVPAENDSYRRPNYQRQAAIFCADASTSEMLRSRLARHGVECVEVVGIEALIYEASRSDIVIVDGTSLMRISNEQLRELANQVHRGFALVPVINTDLPLPLESWLPVTRPLTEAAIEQVLGQVDDTQPAGEPWPQGKDTLTPLNYQCHVLVAEDVEVNQAIAREMLGSLGCDVTIVNNGEQAVEKFRSGNFDLVFMDCQMPIMDGYEAAGRIRDLEQAENRTPATIVALTAAMSRSDEQRCLAAGMSAYMAKPYSLKDLTTYLEPFRIGATPLESLGFMPERSLGPAPGDIIDRAVIDNLKRLGTRDGQSAWDSMYQSFEEHMEEQLPRLATLLEQGSSSEIADAAHYIKSASSCVGACGVTRLCNIVEDRARDECSVPRSMTEDIRRAYEDFRTLIKDLETSAV